MSRSHKHSPICNDGKRGSTKNTKSIANRMVRRRDNRIVKGYLYQDPIYRDEIVLDGKAYKKYYCSWNICDYKCVEFKEWVIQKWYANQKDKLYGVRNYTHYADEPTLEEELNLWKKSYKFK